jgi:hypothetical protein
MPAIGPATLAAAVVLSALGAVVLCALVVLYGFTSDTEPSPRATRRLLLTRFGHVVAAVCFTATAIVIALAAGRAGPPPAPAARPEARAPALDDRLERQEARLEQTEARLRELEETLRRLPTAARPTSPELPIPPPPAASPATTPPRHSSQAASAPANRRAPPPRQHADLPSKLRDDWREIQRGVDSAGDDFRRAVDDLRRRLLAD